MEKTNKTLLDPGIEPRTCCSAVALATTRPTRQSKLEIKFVDKIVQSTQIGFNFVSVLHWRSCQSLGETIIQRLQCIVTVSQITLIFHVICITNHTATQRITCPFSQKSTLIFFIHLKCHNPTVLNPDKLHLLIHRGCRPYKYLEKTKTISRLNYSPSTRILERWKVIRITANSVSCQLTDIWNGANFKNYCDPCTEIRDNSCCNQELC